MSNPASTETEPTGVVMGYFRHPDFPGTDRHLDCGYDWHDHGWIDGYQASLPDGTLPNDGVTVCPSVTGPYPGQTVAMGREPR